MRRSPWISTPLAALVAAAIAAPTMRAGHSGPSDVDERRFPHARHAGLFPTCVGCHGGVLERDSLTVPLVGDAGTSLYPSPSQCAGCHDGVRRPRVEWDGPAREPSNLRFSHARHNAEATLGDPALNCGACHQRRGTTAFMAVGEAHPPSCIACHGHPAPSHLAEESPCRTCHRPLVQAVALTAAQVRAFPEPPSHREPGFIFDHGPTVARSETRCATCHARESCERCHVNAQAVPAIAALAGDARVAGLVATIPAEYPVPPSHRDAAWPYAHGAAARSRIAQCANCHTSSGCRACHTGTLGRSVIARLPAIEGRGVQLRGGAAIDERRPPAHGLPGPTIGDVMLQGQATGSARRDTGRTARPDTGRVRVHPPGFATRHGAAAASARQSCEGCHEAKSFCAQCHDGESKRRFHPVNFAARHPADAYARRTECASCHSREGFCGACHQRVALQSEGRRNVAFHTAQPLWLIQHGRAARQGLESCTTCHRQRDCMQCHSTIGQHVNPHGPGFDAERMASRNPQICRACHLGDPLAP